MLNGKSTVKRQFSIAMFVYQRVSINILDMMGHHFLVAEIGEVNGKNNKLPWNPWNSWPIEIDDSPRKLHSAWEKIHSYVKQPDGKVHEDGRIVATSWFSKFILSSSFSTN